jgi:RNA polymerase sigma-70 factor, ECF subfamily
MPRAEAAVLPIRPPTQNTDPVAAARGEARALEEAALACRIRAGDEAAFERFFTARYAALVAYLRSVVGSAAIAEELAQDVFLRFWRARDRLEPQRSLTAYLFRAARNAGINHLRRDRRERGWLRLQKLLPARHAAAADQGVHVREISTALSAAVAGLPERCRVIYLLSREQGMTYRQIGAALSISVKTVETQMGRAFKVLSERLHPHI